MRCFPILLAGAVSLFVTRTLWAGLVIVPSSPAEQNWVDPTNDPSPVVSVGVDNPMGLTDELDGYTLTARVRPDSGAVGMLEINNMSKPTSGYIFAENGVSFPMVTSGTTATASGFGFPPVTVPSTGSQLVDIDFIASIDAAGLFYVELVPYTTLQEETYWTAMGDPTPIPFDNATTTSPPLLLGTISVGSLNTVPEPETILIWTILAALLSLMPWMNIALNSRHS